MDRTTVAAMVGYDREFSPTMLKDAPRLFNDEPSPTGKGRAHSNLGGSRSNKSAKKGKRPKGLPQAVKDEMAARFAEAEAALGVKEELRVAHIVLPTPVDRTFDYLIPAQIDRDTVRGVRATVPFGKRSLTGYVVHTSEESDISKSRLKGILELPDRVPIVDEPMLRLTEWMAGYYACSWGEALQAVIPAVIRRGKALKTVGVLRMGRSLEECNAHISSLEERAGKREKSPLLKQAKVLQTVVTFEDENWRPAVLAEKLGFSESPITTLKNEGWLRIERVPLVDDEVKGGDLDESPGPLTGEQERAIEAIAPSVANSEYKTFLLRGVTGSGKTEVYLQVLEKTLALGKSAIILVPEISLTPQTVRRFSDRLRGRYRVAVLHSAMTDSDRRREWRRIETGEARVVIGPRSAIFAPVQNLGLVVVDEEHEPSYKQEHTPRYHARDVAVMRCHMQNAVCILGSATPSLESAHNAINKRYTLVELKRRVMERKLPSVLVVDMAEESRTQRRMAMLSGMLVNELRDVIGREEQAVMYLNRRGYHAFFQCTHCRELLKCPNCDAPMHHHRHVGKAVCHYCFETMAAPPNCLTCGLGGLEPKGMGTELLEEELARALPGLRIARMDSDVMKSRDDYESVLGQFKRQEINVLVGTQMIAKGLDFPNVTLVGVIQADLSAQLADFRAQERAFQLLTQVAGRAGRGVRPGRVIVQTFTPHHPCITFAQNQDYWGFFEFELQSRKAAKYPPFVRLLNLTIESRDEAKGAVLGKQIRARTEDWVARNPGRIAALLGPSIAPVSRIRNRHRWQFLVKANDRAAMKGICELLKNEVKISESLRVTLDVDPHSMM